MMVEIELILSATFAETTLEKETGINIFQLFQRIFDNLAGDQYILCLAFNCILHRNELDDKEYI